MELMRLVYNSRELRWIACLFIEGFFFPMALSAHSGLWPFIQFRNHFLDGRTPWASDQPVARPLPTHRTAQTQNKRIHTPNIHDPSVRVSEDSSCLSPRGYCDRLIEGLHPRNVV
jgi:hypothetical protein